MNIATFRTDLRESMSARGINTHRLSILAKVDSASLYNFLKGTASLSGENLLKLYPFIYKAPEKNLPCSPVEDPTATPTTPPGEAGAGEAQPARQESQDA